MSYFDRQRRKMLYELKMKEEVLRSKNTSGKSFKKGQKVTYKDKECIVKYCADGNCVIECGDMQLFVPCSDLTLIKDNKLDEGVFQVTYSTDGVNYHSSVLVRAENKEQAEKIAIDKAKVKPHADSSIIVVERDEDFVKDYHGKRGMNLIESANNPSLGKDATKAIIRILEVGLDLAKMKNHPMTLHELNKLIDDISEVRDTIVSSGDFAITEDLEDNGDTPSTPTTDENNGITTLLNSLIADEIEAIDGYNGAITTIKSIDGIDINTKNNIIEVLTDIAGEENIHIGQLLKALELVNPQAILIKDGEQEASEVIGTPDDSDSTINDNNETEE